MPILRQDAYPLDLAEMEAWVRAHAAPGARVLEIGCGDGELCERLRRDFVVVGADPVATPTEVVRAVGFESLTGPEAEPYDLVFASVSLHHLADRDGAVAALRRLTKPGSVVLVREFDRVVMDHEPTLRWWFDRRPETLVARAPEHDDPDGAHGHGEHGHGEQGHGEQGHGEQGHGEQGHGEHRHGEHGHGAHGHGHGRIPSTFEEFVPWWRAAMEEHVLPFADVKVLLADAGIEALEESTTPYLHRWEVGEAHRSDEERAIADGTIRAVGRRVVGRRR